MLNALVTSAGAVLEKTFLELDALAIQFQSLVMDSTQSKRGLSEAGLNKIRPHMARSLNRLARYAYALGIILDEGIIDGSPFWLNWIERDDDGIIQDDSNIKYPWRGNFYEYPNADWMALPRALGKPVIVGPYVDFDKHIITLAVPIQVNGHFIGVSAADIKLSEFERLVAAPLVLLEHGCVVCNHEGRVVVSNTATHPVGTLNASFIKTGSPISNFGWSVINVGKR